MWSPDGTKFVLDRGTFDISYFLGTSGGTNDSIYLGRPKDTTTTLKLFLEGTNQTTYIPLRWLDNDNFIYEEITYEKPFTDTSSTKALLDKDPHDYAYFDYWMNIYYKGQTGVRRYFKINVNTHISSEIANPNIPTKNYFIKNSPLGNWRAVATTTPSYLLYLEKIDGTKEINLTTVYLFTGAWMPITP